MSLTQRIERLEQSVSRGAPRGGLDAETRRAVLQSMIHATDIVDLEREIAVLESYGHDQVRALDAKILYRADLPRMRAERDARWRGWIASRFGADVAERFFASFESPNVAS
jgi:hypothetical protein